LLGLCAGKPFDSFDIGGVLILCRRGIQLTDEIEFEKASAEVDEEKAEEAMKEYRDASK
jgi:hypothetical protein